MRQLRETEPYLDAPGGGWGKMLERAGQSEQRRYRFSLDALAYRCNAVCLYSVQRVEWQWRPWHHIASYMMQTGPITMPEVGLSLTTANRLPCNFCIAQ